MINPTVGRIVWYRPDEADKKGSAEPPMQTCGDDPLAAQIVAVHGPRMVSVALYDAAGRHFARPSVALLQDDDKIPSGRYVEWMPYQRERTAAASIDNSAKNVISTTAAASISHGDYQTEIAIQAAGLNAPRIKPEDVLAAIDSETYTITPSGRTTICELTLTNGFTVRGESSVVSMANFDEAIGRSEARKKAIDKVWELEGYRLMQKLYEQRTAALTKDSASDMEGFLQKLQSLIDVQLMPGTIDQGEYMRGMANGMLLAKSVADGKEPPFVSAPELTFQDRVRNEYAELAQRLSKLEPFIDGEKFTTLPEAEQDRMMAQHGAMTQYATALKARIEAFDPAPVGVEDVAETKAAE